MSVFLRCCRTFLFVGFVAVLTFMMMHVVMWSCWCRHSATVLTPAEVACVQRSPVEVQTRRFLLSSQEEIPCSDTLGPTCTSAGRMAVLPLEAGQSFGWQLYLPHAPEGVMVREELILPKSPLLWETGYATRLYDGGRIAVTDTCMVPQEGWVSQFWALSPGDPQGKYQIRVWVNGLLTETFVFHVQ